MIKYISRRMDKHENHIERIMMLCETFMTQIDIDVEWDRVQRKIMEKVDKKLASIDEVSQKRIAGYLTEQRA